MFAFIERNEFVHCSSNTFLAPSGCVIGKKFIYHEGSEWRKIVLISDLIPSFVSFLLFKKNVSSVLDSRQYQEIY